MSVLAQTPPESPKTNVEPISLTAGSAINRQLTAGANEVFDIWLSPGDLLRLSVDKADFALSFAVYDPRHVKLLEQVSYGFEVLDLSIPAESAGKYRFEVHSLELSEPSRRYELRLEPIRRATPLDHRIHLAQQLTASATILRAEWTANALRQAIEKYDEAAVIWSSLQNLQSAAVATMEAAEVCLMLGQYREALKRYQKAKVQAKTAHARFEESKALSEAGRLHSYLGDNDTAQRLVGQALKLVAFDNQANQPVPLKITYAENLLNLGEVTYSKGNLLKSSKEFEESLKLFDEIGDRSGAARAHLFLGYISGSLGDPEKAVAEIAQALNLYRKMRHKTGEGWCLSALGIAYSVDRKEDQAIKHHNEAIDLFRVIGDRQSEAIAVNGLGQAYEYLSEYATSLEHYRRALKLFQDSGSLDFASVTLLNVARVYRLVGDREQAFEYYEMCLQLSRLTKKVRAEANALNEVAALYADQGNRQQTIKQYQKILRFYARISDRRGQATAWNNLGDIYFRFGENKQALRSYELALTLSEQAGDKALQISALYNIARTQRDSGLLEDALASIEASIKIIEDLRSNVASADFRISYFAGVRQHYDLCINILMRLHRQQPGQGFDVAALLTSEKSRARSLLDILTEVRADVRPGAAPELIARERHLRSLLRAHALYEMELSISGKDPAEKDEVSRQINELRAEYRQVETQLKEENPRFAVFDQSTALTLEQVQSELRDGDTILLEYALGEERSYLWAVTADSLRSYELPSRSTLENAGGEVYKLMTARQEVGESVAGDYQSNVETSDRARQDKAVVLSQLLLGPVADQIGSKRLIIVTEGILQYIPFEALPSPQSKSAELRSGSVSSNSLLLLDTNEVVTLPSVSTLIAIRRQKVKAVSNNKVVMVFADPVFNTNDDRLKNDGRTTPALASSDQYSSPVALRGLARGGGPRRLVHSSEEADAIVATAPRGSTMVARAFDANREAAMQPAVGGYQIVHFATHGFFNSEHPELSGIVLSMIQPDGSKINGFMALQDIYKLDLSAQLVVLSACDTALGKDMKGEGLVSLTRGFMYAGSKSVVTSLWKVDDRATAQLMKHLYESMLRDGMTPAAALRSAKQKIRREKSWSEPFFWAGFVLHGEYKERIMVGSDPLPRSALVVSVALILVLVGGIILQRSRRARLLNR
ncbi:MAG TPA: CHAT domain-containing tetratricopeptide repeat protein [Pyrinomonadaceae bacterium]|nr:CHAT domain-containing tetratricopeptide repeat protein [Pyrinomonadaceae bacterium]